MSTSLPVLAEPRCACGTVPTVMTVTQPALFIHAGFGAAETKTVVLCGGCWTVRVVEVAASNPRNI